MRTAIATLILAAAVGSAAQAQAPAPAAAPATPPAPAAATPATATPAPTAPATTTPATAAPPDAAAPPAATPAPPAEAAPTLPTTGDGAAVLAIIEKICVPLVRGGNLDDLAKANGPLGLKKNRKDNTWSATLGTDKTYNLTIFAPGSNRDVCRGEVHYALNQEAPIVSAINIWSFLHQPELILQANYVAVDADGVKRVRKSWEHLESASSTAINFSTLTKPDDSPLNAKYSTGEFFYQERKF